MKAAVIEIGRFIKVPFDVVTAGVSPRAFQVWARIAAEASPKNPLAQVHQRKLAVELGCSTQTVGQNTCSFQQERGNAVVAKPIKSFGTKTQRQ